MPCRLGNQAVRACRAQFHVQTDPVLVRRGANIQLVFGICCLAQLEAFAASDSERKRAAKCLLGNASPTMDVDCCNPGVHSRWVCFWKNVVESACNILLLNPAGEQGASAKLFLDANDSHPADDFARLGCRPHNFQYVPRLCPISCAEAHAGLAIIYNLCDVSPGLVTADVADDTLDDLNADILKRLMFARRRSRGTGRRGRHGRWRRCRHTWRPRFAVPSRDDVVGHVDFNIPLISKRGLHFANGTVLDSFVFIPIVHSAIPGVYVMADFTVHGFNHYTPRANVAPGHTIR